MKWTVMGIIFAALSIISNVMLDDYVPGFAFLIMCFIAHATSDIIKAINQTHLQVQGSFLEGESDV